MHYQCLILFQQFFDYQETFLKFEATENREWGEFFVPFLDLRTIEMIKFLPVEAKLLSSVTESVVSRKCVIK